MNIPDHEATVARLAPDPASLGHQRSQPLETERNVSDAHDEGRVLPPTWQAAAGQPLSETPRRQPGRHMEHSAHGRQGGTGGTGGPAGDRRGVGGPTSRRRMLQAALGVGMAVLWAGSWWETRLARALADSEANGAIGQEALTVVVRWNTAALTALQTVGAGPPIVARTLAIVHTCMYDAWAAYSPRALGTQLGGALRVHARRSHANKTQAVSYAAYRALVDLLPSQTATFTTLMASLGYDPADTSTNTATPTGIGNVAAAAVLDYRHHDESNQLGDLHPGAYSDYTGYTPVNDPDHLNDPSRWQPLRVGSSVQQFVTPQWGRVVPFALSAGSQFRPAGPATYPSPAYTAQANEILGFSAGLTDMQKVIAEYWADPPAPAQWSAFAQVVSQRDGHDLDDDVPLFFVLTNALLDASIACWDAKRAFDSVRPVSAIHYLFAGTPVTAWGGPFRGTQVIDGATWQPYLLRTPAFPEYVSAHSTVSAASAEILARFTGSTAFGLSYRQAAGTSRIEPGLTPATDVVLSWATFSEAADQAGLSRRYGGIHFEAGDLMGRALGRLVAAQVWNKAQSYLHGQTPSDCPANA